MPPPDWLKRPEPREPISKGSETIVLEGDAFQLLHRLMRQAGYADSTHYVTRLLQKELLTFDSARSARFGMF